MARRPFLDSLFSPFLRSALRQVRDTLPRFLSILLITVLGVAFFSGLRLTGPYMEASAEKWLDERNFMDIQIYSTMGFDDDDIHALRSTPGILNVSPGYHTNVLVKRNNSETSVLFLSLDLGINTPELLNGRLPAKPNECLAESEWFGDTDARLGDTVQVFSGTSDPLNNRLAISTYTIVGVVDSPLFMAEDRGNSDIGAGHNSYFFLVLPSAFTFELYTTVYLQIGFARDSAALSSAVPPSINDALNQQRYLPFSRFDDAYLKAVAPIVKALEQTAEARGAERYKKIMDEARKELDDARAKVKDGYQELQDAKDELAQARIDLEKGQIELDEGRADLDDGWAQLAQSRKKLDDGWAKSNASRPTLDVAWAEMRTSRTTLDENWAQLALSRTTLDEGWADYEEQRLGLEFAEANGLLDEIQLAYAKLMLQQAYEELEYGEAVYEGGRMRLELAEIAYQSGLAELRAGEAAYQDGVAELLAGEAAYQEGLAGLEQGEASFASALEEFNKGKDDYEAGLATFEQEYPDALAELVQAEEDITQAEKDLEALKVPKWYVLDLDSNAGFRSYKQESEQLKSIAIVIPLLFFLIAALVSMTSMTRLVDKDRTIIGTYKALGYSNMVITMRYLAYAFCASLIGGILGVIVGYNLFPPLIFNAFHAIYSVPPAPPFFSWPYAILSIAVALLSTVSPAVFVTLRTLRETPASAMRPLAPRPGKRIILERIKPLWRRLSFLHKITARNLFRYKKRALMTVLGIAGCTALMFTGFALNDSLATLGPKQFGQIQRFDVAISFNVKADPEDLRALYDYVNRSADFSSHMMVRRETVEIVGPLMTKDLAILVPEDPGSFQDYYAMRPRAASLLSRPGQPYLLTDDGIFITEQLARQAGVVLGDIVTLRTFDNEEAQFKVSGIIENYVYHYAIMTPAVYEQAFGQAPEFNQILGLFAPGSTGLPSTVTGFEAVNGVAYTQRSADSFANITDILGFVMAILILSAAAQAFVVLFSLNTINREERARELASIKVLGFFNRELATYIYREGLVLTAVGIVLGLFFGIGLERYIINTIEIDVFMFSRDILFTSFLWSALFTALFAVIVNLLIYRPLTRIDMVSSLKAVE